MERGRLSHSPMSNCPGCSSYELFLLVHCSTLAALKSAACVVDTFMVKYCMIFAGSLYLEIKCGSTFLVFTTFNADLKMLEPHLFAFELFRK